MPGHDINGYIDPWYDYMEEEEEEEEPEPIEEKNRWHKVYDELEETYEE